ncbi:MAG: hypothetical protein P1U78_04815 [Alcanivoracaceae bacterium]|nr:hypothetical protein [Alcanivoracaceae bacterium]
MTLQAIEGTLTWFSGLKPEDLPSNLSRMIRVHLRRDELGIEAVNVAGSVPLANGKTLQIIPKIGKLNFFRLLLKADGHQDELERIYEQFVEYSVEDEASIEHVVARSLLVAADEIMRKSPLQERVSKRRRGLFARGDVNVVETAMNVACCREEPVVYKVKERTTDIPENRIISEALKKAGALLFQKGTDREYQSVVDRWTGRFPRPDDIGADATHIEERFSRGKYGGARDYYKKALMLSLVILGVNGIGIGNGKSVLGDAILFNTADVFERYLRNVLRDLYNNKGYLVVKGGSAKSTLYTDGSFELSPDIVIERNGQIQLIADAKYKIPSASDHYQMHAYLSANNLTKGVILAPLFDGELPIVREYITPDRVIVIEALLPMHNLDVVEEFLSTLA